MSLSLRKVLALPVVGLLVFVGCATDDQVEDAGDSPAVTCERLTDVVAQFTAIDPASMDFGEIFSLANSGFAELKAITDDAADADLADSIATLRDGLNSAIASAGSEPAGVVSSLFGHLQDPALQDAAASMAETCDVDLWN